MDMPGRQELRKTYEELHDEILIEIALNTDREYENVAVEVAGAELDKRGVPIPGAEEDSGDRDDSDGHLPRGRRVTAESIKWYGKKLSGPLIEIPRFTIEESVEIEGIFAENNIPHEKRSVTIEISPAGHHEYMFYVPRDSLTSAIEILKQYYLGAAEVQSTGYYSGKCPACGTELAEVESCTDCGLTLAGDYSEFLGGHPFFIFLKNNAFL